MSLLMEALRKAEQAKKQAAGAPVIIKNPVTAPGGREQRVLVEPLLALEVQDSPGNSPLEMDDALAVDLPEPLQIDPGAADEAGSGAGVSEQENILAVEGGMADIMVVDTPLPNEPEGQLGLESGRGPGAEAPVEVPPAEEVSAPSADEGASKAGRGPERDVADVSAICPVTPSDASSRQVARTVFTAKKEYQRRSRNRRLLVLGTGGIALLTMAGFLWYEYHSLNGSVTPGAALETSRVIQGAADGSSGPLSPGDGAVPSVGSGAETAGIEVVGAAPAPRSGDAPSPAPPALPLPRAAADLSEAATPVSPVSVPGSVPATAAAQVDPEESAPPRDGSGADPVPDAAVEDEPPAAPPIVITRRPPPRPQVSPLLTAAYGAYQQGDYQQARQKYQQVLQADPENRAALLGVAAIALYGHEETLARELYLRVLDQDPGDPLARAGLLAITPAGDPVHQESELKLLLELHPGSAPLFFSLGNLYAAGNRWSEAQQAYFNALQAAKNVASAPGADRSASTNCVHPDYPFNLAVSLEHLGQLKPAAGFYRKALDCAADRPAGFDPAGLRARLQTLEQGERR